MHIHRGVARTIASGRLFPAVGIVLLLVVLLLWWAEGARQPYIQDTFSYSADTLSNDNFYDEANQRYSGERNARGEFSYQVSGRARQDVLIRNTLATTAIDGQAIGTIKRDYRADPQTGQLAQTSDPAKGGASLFAPRNLRRGQAFAYYHITYDAPAQMSYEGEEELFGLPVYRYKARYGSAGSIEQAGMPVAGVPSGQGIVSEPRLKIWVEPVTGWLVKFEDDTTLYRFDRQTGKRLGPFSHSYSRFTEESVRQHAAYARVLKYQQLFARQMAPGLVLLVLLALAVAFLVGRHKTIALPVNAAMGVVAVLAMTTLGGWLFGLRPLVTFFASGAAVNPLVSVCALLVAVCLLLLYRDARSNPALFVTGLVVIFAGLQGLGSMNMVPFTLDLALFKDAVLALDESIPTRMSLYSAFTFLILGAGLGRVALSKSAASLQFAKFAAGIVTTLGVVGLLMQFLQLDKAFTLPFLYSLSAAAAVIFVVSGFTFLQILQRIEDRGFSIHSTLKELIRPGLATIPLVVIASFAQFQQNVVGQKLEARFNEQIISVQSAVDNKIQTYGNFLLGGRALFAASQAVERDEWQKYVDAVEIDQNYPGMTVAAYAKVLQNDQLNSFTDQIRRSGNPSFAIFPESRRTLRAPLVYAEPTHETNRKLLGFDVFSDSVGSEALERARDGGSVNASGKLQIPGRIGLPGSASFLMVAPLYHEARVSVPVDQRKPTLDGYVVSAFDMETFMKDALRGLARNMDIEVYDGLQTSSTTQLYHHRNKTALFAPGQQPRLTKSVVQYVANHPWTLSFKALPTFRLSRAEERLPTGILIGGGLAYFFALITLYPLLRGVRTNPRTKRGP